MVLWLSRHSVEIELMSHDQLAISLAYTTVDQHRPFSLWNLKLKIKFVWKFKTSHVQISKLLSISIFRVNTDTANYKALTIPKALTNRKLTGSGRKTFITRPEGQLKTPERPPHKETEYCSMDVVLRKVHFYTVLFQIPTCNVVCFVKVQIILENSLRGGCC